MSPYTLHGTYCFGKWRKAGQVKIKGKRANGKIGVKKGLGVR